MDLQCGYNVDATFLNYIMTEEQQLMCKKCFAIEYVHWNQSNYNNESTECAIVLS